MILVLCKRKAQAIFLPFGKKLIMPLLFSFQLLDSWLNSQKDNERERAMWCVARILGFTVKMNNFEVSGYLPYSLGPGTPSGHLYPKLYHV
jgi:hypothetical protein